MLRPLRGWAAEPTVATSEPQHRSAWTLSDQVNIPLMIAPSELSR